MRRRLGFCGFPYSTHRESPRYAGSISTVNIGLLLAAPASGVAANGALEHPLRALGRPPDRLPVLERHGDLFELALGRSERGADCRPAVDLLRDSQGEAPVEVGCLLLVARVDLQLAGSR